MSARANTRYDEHGLRWVRGFGLTLEELGWCLKHYAPEKHMTAAVYERLCQSWFRATQYWALDRRHKLMYRTPEFDLVLGRGPRVAIIGQGRGRSPLVLLPKFALVSKRVRKEKTR